MDSQNNVATAIAQADLFVGLGKATTDDLAAIADIQEHGENDVIYQPGDPADNVYILLDGRVNFRMQPENYDEIPATIMSSKKAFGWAALVPDHPDRVAIASCLDASRVVALDGNRVSDVLERHPEDGYLVMKRLTAIVARSFMPN